MYIRFKHSFAYTFPKAKNNPLKINYPGPGTYDPGEDNEMVNPPKWKFGMAPRDNKIHELSPGPAYYNSDLEYRKSSKVPNAPLYSFYKTSGVIPKKRKKKNSNKNYIKNTKKKNNNDSYLDDNNPGVGSYNLRSSLVVPVVKFGTERKDIGYKDTPSKGPASYDTRGNLGDFGPKINFGKDKRGKTYYSISPGPKYNMRYKDNDFPKFSFGKEVRMKESNFQKKKVKLERNFVKVKNYKKIYLYKEDNNVNVDQRKKGYVVSDYKLSQTGFPKINFPKSHNSNFQKNSKQYENNKIDERENSRFDSFRKPAWVSRKFYNDLMKKKMKTKIKEKENKEEIKEENKEEKIEGNIEGNIEGKIEGNIEGNIEENIEKNRNIEDIKKENIEGKEEEKKIQKHKEKELLKENLNKDEKIKENNKLMTKEIKEDFKEDKEEENNNLRGIKKINKEEEENNELMTKGIKEDFKEDKEEENNNLRVIKKINKEEEENNEFNDISLKNVNENNNNLLYFEEESHDSIIDG